MADINKSTERRRKEWVIKSDIDLKNTVDEIRRERVIKGLDNETISYNELLKASFRFTPLIDILKKADIKRGQNDKLK